jgi:FkbM family methyltransferase
MIYDALIKSEYYVPVALQPKVILDIGSNIGTTILYLHHRFPSARIYGFEPHPDTYRILELNVSQIPLVSLFNFGLNGCDRHLEVPFDGVNFSAFSTNTSSSTEDAARVRCEVRNAATALLALGLKEADLIKIDCEGAEYDVLTTLPENMLAKCKWIVGEIHEANGFELLAFLASHFELDLQKKMFAPKFLFHACNKDAVSQLRGTFRRSDLKT